MREIIREGSALTNDRSPATGSGVPVNDRRRFLAAVLGGGTGAATAYAYGRPDEGGVVEATEADLAQLEISEPDPGLSPGEFAEKLDEEVRRYAASVQGQREAQRLLLEDLEGMDPVDRELVFESMGSSDQRALIAAAPFFFAGKVVSGQQETSRRGLFKTGAIAAGIGALAALTPEQAQALEIRRTELQRKIQTLAEASATDMIETEGVEMAMVWSDIACGRRDGETREQLRERRRTAQETTAEKIQWQQRSTATRRTRDGREVTLPTNHNQLRWRVARRVRVGDETRMGRMNYIISNCGTLKDADNPCGIKIAKRLSIFEDRARTRFQYYVSNF